MKKLITLIFILFIMATMTLALKDEDQDFYLEDAPPNTASYDHCPDSESTNVDDYGCDCKQKTASECDGQWCCEDEEKCIVEEGKASCRNVKYVGYEDNCSQIHVCKDELSCKSMFDNSSESSSICCKQFDCAVDGECVSEDKLIDVEEGYKQCKNGKWVDYEPPVCPNGSISENIEKPCTCGGKLYPMGRIRNTMSGEEESLFCCNGEISDEPCFECKDTDGGKNYYEYGEVKYGDQINEDTCSEAGPLFEQYCKNGTPVQTTYECPNGCEDGACVNSSYKCYPKCEDVGGVCVEKGNGGGEHYEEYDAKGASYECWSEQKTSGCTFPSPFSCEEVKIKPSQTETISLELHNDDPINDMIMYDIDISATDSYTTKRWFKEGEDFTTTINGIEHNLSFIDITLEENPACGIKIDNVVRWIDPGESELVNGVRVTVFDSKKVKTPDKDADSCKIGVSEQSINCTVERRSDLIVDSDDEEQGIPDDCTKWFDGCNTCQIVDGKPTKCTEVYCEPEEYEESKCLEYSGSVKKQAKCIFADSEKEQKCYTDDEKFVCSGTDSCKVNVSGEEGDILDWKSSCGGRQLTKIDGKHEKITFNCTDDEERNHIGNVVVDGDTQEVSFERIDVGVKGDTEEVSFERIDDAQPTPPQTQPYCKSANISKHYSLASNYIDEKFSSEYSVNKSSNRQVGSCNEGNTASTAFDVYDEEPSSKPYITGEIYSITKNKVLVAEEVIYGDVEEDVEESVLDKESDDTKCETLWWYDKDTPECQKKEFCGNYMYEGLQTFQTERECQEALDEGFDFKGKAVEFEIDDETRLVGKDGKRISMDDLKIGQKVEGRVSGDVKETYPAQAMASKIKVVGGNHHPPSEEVILKANSTEKIVINCDDGDKLKPGEPIKVYFTPNYHPSSTTETHKKLKGLISTTVESIQGKDCKDYGEDFWCSTPDAWKRECDGEGFILDRPKSLEKSSCTTKTGDKGFCVTCEDCVDTDGGKNYFEKGKTTGRDVYGGNKNLIESYEDKCDGDRLMEFYCNDKNSGEYDGYVSMTNVPCPGGCVDGECRQSDCEGLLEKKCIENFDCRPLYETKGAFIFKREVYAGCTEATCDDGKKNQGEKFTDFGGPCEEDCSKLDEKECSKAKECNPNYETYRRWGFTRELFTDCTEATCDDGKKNQGEKFTDFGGPCEEDCSKLEKKECEAAPVCEPEINDSGWRTSKVLCKEATCDDGKKNQGEKFTDFGGPCEEDCNKLDEKECSRAKECNPNYKTNRHWGFTTEEFTDCTEATCDDGVKNQDELFTDFGGPCEKNCKKLSKKECEKAKVCNPYYERRGKGNTFEGCLKEPEVNIKINGERGRTHNISKGSTLLLEWDSKHAESCNSTGYLYSANMDTSGKKTFDDFNPSKTSFTITCLNKGGSSSETVHVYTHENYDKTVGEECKGGECKESLDCKDDLYSRISNNKSLPMLCCPEGFCLADGRCFEEETEVEGYTCEDGEWQKKYNLIVRGADTGNTTPEPGTYKYKEGERVSVVALPDSGFEFSEWEAKGSATKCKQKENCTFSIYENTTLYPSFKSPEEPQEEEEESA